MDKKIELWEISEAKDIPPDPVPHHDPDELSNQPEYKELLLSYQKGEWAACDTLLERLLQQFPHSRHLHELKENLETQLAFRDQSRLFVKTARRRRVRKILGTTLMILGGLAIGVLAYGVILFKLLPAANSGGQQAGAEAQVNMEALADLEEQVRILLQNGNSEVAFQVIDQIRALDSNYTALPELVSQAEALSEIDLKYRAALEYVDEGNLPQALELFQQIDAVIPQYRDVSHQIQVLEAQIRLAELVVTAEEAYQREDWRTAIAAYEEILTLDHSLDEQELEQKLFLSYYHEVNHILSSQDTTIEDINLAETYYLNAIALVPGNTQFSEEKADLQRLIDELLVEKYGSPADSLINRQDGSERSVALAIQYYQKAIALATETYALENDLSSAQTYLQALQSFNELDWDYAIKYLEDIAYFDQNYAGGMLRRLLYESYAARGRRYYSVGYYSDARANFEAAEIIAWKDESALLPLYEIQIDLAFTFGKMHNYQVADAYFESALAGVNAAGRITNESVLDALASAKENYENRNYPEAYRIYEEVLADRGMFSSDVEAFGNKGDSLAALAAAHDSTIYAILTRNSMDPTTLLDIDGVIQIPVIEP